MKRIVATLATSIALSMAMAGTAQAQTACVFDLAGTSGDTFTMMKDYALAAKGWGVNLSLKAYTDERVAAEDFKAGKCDLVALTAIRGRKLNSFTGSIDAIGAIPSNNAAKAVMTLLTTPKLHQIW